MDTPQQREALAYFQEHAQQWQRQAAGAEAEKFNIVKARNAYVMQVVRQRAHTAAALDVGCGAGELVCDLAEAGIPAAGIDFANEMIELAQAAAAARRLSHAEFYCSSIFEYAFGSRTFDVVSANGFIEYISYAQLEQFFDLAARLLNPGGALVVGSRNRLFNLLSLNSFTQDEMQSGAALLLLQEALALAQGTALADLARLESPPRQAADLEHAPTGVQVKTRYQFTPVQLMKLLAARGFTTRQLYPVHIHGAPPAFKAQSPAVHVGIANLLQDYAATSPALLPFASTFMLHATKED